MQQNFFVGTIKKEAKTRHFKFVWRVKNLLNDLIEMKLFIAMRKTLSILEQNKARNIWNWLEKRKTCKFFLFFLSLLNLLLEIKRIKEKFYLNFAFSFCLFFIFKWFWFPIKRPCIVPSHSLACDLLWSDPSSRAGW